jgi:hypothetical protein
MNAQEGLESSRGRGRSDMDGKWERTGEFRVPRVGDWFECTGPGGRLSSTPMHYFEGAEKDWQAWLESESWILRRVEPAVASAPERPGTEEVVNHIHVCASFVDHTRASLADFNARTAEAIRIVKAHEKVREEIAGASIAEISERLSARLLSLLDSDAGREGATQ